MNNRDFTAPYVFHEYPKWVTLADGSKALANNSDEERILVGQHDDDQDQAVIESTAVPLGKLQQSTATAQEDVAVKAEAAPEDQPAAEAPVVEAVSADVKTATSRRRGNASQAEAAKE